MKMKSCLFLFPVIVTLFMTLAMTATATKTETDWATLKTCPGGCAVNFLCVDGDCVSQVNPPNSTVQEEEKRNGFPPILQTMTKSLRQVQQEYKRRD